MAALIAGAAVADITPADSQFLFGYPHVPRYSTGVHDRLYSTALYLCDGATQALFIANDIIFVTKAMAERLRGQIAAHTGIPAGHVMITATHTHSAPKTVDYISNADDPLVPPVDEGYVRFFEARMLEAAVAAYRGAQPAEVGLAVANGKGVGANRRDPAGPADPAAPALMVRAAGGGAPIACMVVYSMHPTVLREDSWVVSADFPGAARSYVQREALGADCPFLYHTGPAGNQSPRHVVKENTIAEMERVGAMLGRAIAAVIPDIAYRDDLPLAAARRFVDLPRRALPSVADARRELAAAVERLAALRHAGAPRQQIRKAEVDWFGAEETVTVARASQEGLLEGVYAACLPAEVQVIRLGPWSFVGWPGEVFVEHALALKALAPDAFVISLANGELQGYIATEEAAAEGGYETTNALFAPAAGRVLVDASLALLRDVAGSGNDPMAVPQNSLLSPLRCTLGKL